ncbi:hypothetical protein HYU14_02595 [Candidatus Woesearchaeota archaeon]|nr:hypothetical protein [Candidatus Woesearchaeota archaeon]
MLSDERKARLYYELFTDDNRKLQDAFCQVRDEFEEHLTAINENTAEVQAANEFLINVEQKMAKIEDRLDKLCLFFEKAGLPIEQEQEFQPIKLTKREQEVFLVLYTQEDIKGSLTYLDIAHCTGLPEDLVASYLSSMMGKGVPIRKNYVHNQAHFSLNPKFKTVQAKENLLQIEQKMLVY